MDVKSCIGGCLPLFFIAIFFDVIGLILLFIGIFANLRVDGRFYGDFLIYTGSLVVFVSLVFWLMWYVGNVQVSEDDDGLKKKSSIVLLARKLSERLSQTLKGEGRVKCVVDEPDCGQMGSPPPRKASRVTWGKSTAYNNDGYDDSLDCTTEEEKKKKEEERQDT